MTSPAKPTTNAAGPGAVLLTQSQPADMAGALAALGIASLANPLLTARATIVDWATLGRPADEWRAALLTSANAVPALAAAPLARDLPVYTVGDSTAAAVRAAGFTDTVSADGDANALAALVRRARAPADGPLLYLAGAEVAGDLAAQLGQDGFNARRVDVYRMVAARALAPATVTALADGALSAAALMSRRAAEVFVNLVTAAAATGKIARLDAVCLSPQIAEVAATLTWRRLITASAPTHAAMIATLAAANRER